MLSLDWVDTAGTLKQAWGDAPIGAKVILVSPDAHSHRGWSMDYQGLPPADVYMMCEPDPVLPLLLQGDSLQTGGRSDAKRSSPGNKRRSPVHPRSGECLQ